MITQQVHNKERCSYGCDGSAGTAYTLSIWHFPLNFVSRAAEINHQNQESEIFLGLIWGRISFPSQLKNEQKLLKMVYINTNFLVLHFGENFMKIITKIAKLQMHENLHKNVNENMFSFTFLCKFSWFFKKGN